MTMRERAGTLWEYIVTWCGHPCADNPHATKADAEAWLKRIEQSAKDAKQPFYGSYSINRVRTRYTIAAPFDVKPILGPYEITKGRTIPNEPITGPYSRTKPHAGARAQRPSEEQERK